MRGWVQEAGVLVLMKKFRNNHVLSQRYPVLR